MWSTIVWSRWKSELVNRLRGSLRCLKALLKIEFRGLQANLWGSQDGKGIKVRDKFKRKLQKMRRLMVAKKRLWRWAKILVRLKINLRKNFKKTWSLKKIRTRAQTRKPRCLVIWAMILMMKISSCFSGHSYSMKKLWIQKEVSQERKVLKSKQ